MSTTSTTHRVRAVVAAVAAVATVLACSGANGNGGGSGNLFQDSCLAGFYPGGGTSCVACLRATCPLGLDALQNGCSGALACFCPSGTLSPTAIASPACTNQLIESSCVAATQSNASIGVCSACDAACGRGTSSGTSSGSGSGSGGNSGGFDFDGGSSSSGGSSGGFNFDAGGTSSGSGSGSGGNAGSSCGGDTTGCNTVCSSSETCPSGSTVQFCSSSVSCCWDTCYWTVGGQETPCASCSDSDVASCRQVALAGCQ